MARYTCCFSLYGDEPDLLSSQSSIMALGSEPCSFVNNVNVVTVTFHHSSLDLFIPGHDAINLRHFYSSDTCFENWMGKVALSTNFPTRIIHAGLNEIEPKHLSAESTQGSFLHYKSKSGSGERCNRTYYLHPRTIHKGLTNTGNGQISARTNLKNSWFRIEGKGMRNDPYANEITAGFGDGTFRKYHRLYRYKENVSALKDERRPNSTHLRFRYDSNERLKNICLFDEKIQDPIAWLELDYDSDERTATIQSSNGKTVSYSFLRRKHDLFGSMKYIEKIESYDNPTVEFDYTKIKEGYAITRVHFPNGHFLEVDYDKKGRVHALRGPLGRLYSFVYNDYQTEVLDALYHKSLYHYSTRDRLTIVDRYADKKLSRRERFFWGDEGSITDGYRDTSDEGNLVARALMTTSDKALFSPNYAYDSHGNVLEETLYGNITGEAPNPFSIDDKGRPKSASPQKYKKYKNRKNKAS